MRQPTVVLIQKPDAPYRDLLLQTLNQEYGAGGWRNFAAVQGNWTPGEPLVALWDLHGHQPDEVWALASVLGAEEVGVVLICAQVDGLVLEALRSSGALALVTAPRHAQEVAAALEMAVGIQQRLGGLMAQRQELQQELAERQEIETAKQVLMASRGFSEAQAMRALQKRRRDSNQKLVDVARQVVVAHQAFNPDDED